MIKRAILLAGGKGTRLKPFTKILPKSLSSISRLMLKFLIRPFRATE